MNFKATVMPIAKFSMMHQSLRAPRIKIHVFMPFLGSLAWRTAAKGIIGAGIFANALTPFAV